MYGPTPGRNGHGRQPQPLLALQLVLLDNGQVLVQTPPEQPLATGARIMQAAFTCQRAHLLLQGMAFPPPEDGIEAAPPGMPVERNPRA